MESILRGYQINDQTWFYQSFILIITVYFRFGRFWSLRNLDILLLLSLSPGLLLVSEHPPAGYLWLFTATGIILIRLFVDSWLQRRPQMEPNLNDTGLTFLGVAVFAFLTMTVMSKPLPESTERIVQKADQILKRQDHSAEQIIPDPQPTKTDTPQAGPAASLLATPVVPITGGLEIVAAHFLAILVHAVLILGLFLLAKRHFEDARIGLFISIFYLLLPCTAYDAGKVNHVLPAALIVWGLVAYRRPMIAGALMGLACGTLFFPIFLLPLWAAFYGRRGAMKFGLALGIVGAVLLGSLVLTSADTYSFKQQTLGSIDWSVLSFKSGNAAGFWSNHDEAYRIPVFVAYLLMLICLTIWPRKKNFEHLLAHSAAIVVGTQFWYPQQGGVYLLWYLPLLLLVVFRPKLIHLQPLNLESPPKQTANSSESQATESPSHGTPVNQLLL